jgi:mRNA interferase RelE/StbE
LAWTIEYTDSARRQLRKLDKQAALRIVNFMDERVAKAANPRDLGKALTGESLGEYWRYRVGDYRIVCDIQDKKLCVLVIRVGSRREVYR